LNLESWILILILGTWILKLDSWFLKSNFLFKPWSVLDSILNSFYDSLDHHLCYHEVFLTFELFVITFVIIKTSLNQSWFIMKLASTHNNVWMYVYMILMMPKKYQTRLLQRISIASRLIHDCFNKQILVSRFTKDQALPQNKVFPRHPRL